MAAIGRFQKGEDIFHAKVVDGELFRLRGDLFGSPSFDKKPTPSKGLRVLTPVTPTKVIAVGLNYADHAQESERREPMGTREVLRYVYAARTVRRDEARPARSDYPAFPERPASAELEHEPVNFRLLQTGQLHFHEHDAAPRRRDSYGHTER